MKVAVLFLCALVNTESAALRMPSNFYPFGGNGSEKMDGTVYIRRISLLDEMTYLGEMHSVIYITKVGAFAFQPEFPTPTSPLAHPGIIAPLWSYLSYGDGTGLVFYEQTTDQSILTRAKDDVHENFHCAANFEPSFVLIGTWYNMPFDDCVDINADVETKINQCQCTNANPYNPKDCLCELYNFDSFCSANCSSPGAPLLCQCGHYLEYQFYYEVVDYTVSYYQYMRHFRGIQYHCNCLKTHPAEYCNCLTYKVHMGPAFVYCSCKLLDDQPDDYCKCKANVFIYNDDSGYVYDYYQDIAYEVSDEFCKCHYIDELSYDYCLCEHEGYCKKKRSQHAENPLLISERSLPDKLYSGRLSTGSASKWSRKHNTFQAVLITNGTDMFVIFNYKRVHVTKYLGNDTYPAVVGFGGPPPGPWEHKLSYSSSLYKLRRKSNVGQRGRWMYHLNSTAITEAGDC